MSDRDRKSSRRSSPPRASGRDVRDVRDRDVRDVRDGGGSSSSRHSSRRDKSRSPERRRGSGGDDRRRSRSRSRSRDREERRERRKKKGSGWDQPPDASAPAPAAAASNPAFAGLHPARVAQLMAMGQMPTGPSEKDRFETEQRGGGRPSGGGGFDAHRDVREMRGRSPPRGGGGGGHFGSMQYAGGLLPNGGRDNPAALLPGASSQTPQQIASRQLRRLYVGNLLPDTTEDDLKVFFSKAMAAANPNLEPGDSVVSVYLNLPKKFGFVEMRTPDEATLCLALDSIQFRGQSLKVRRPSDYNPVQQYAASGLAPPPNIVHQPPAPSLAALQGMAAGAAMSAGAAGAGAGAAALPGGEVPWNGVTSTQVPDGPNKVFCGGLPYSLNEAEVKELLAVYGPLRAFHLVRDKDANQSKGFCFFEYVSPAITDDAVKGLNGLEIRGKTLTVRRAQARAAMQQNAAAAGLGALAGLGAANPLLALGGMPGLLGAAGLPGLAGVAGLNPALLAAAGVNPAALGLPGLTGLAGAAVPAAPAQPATRVLCLTQMVSAEELASDSEYKEISEDIEGECRKYGDLKSVVIPRPSGGQDAAAAAAAGVGKVFVEYSDSSMAAKARADLEGRQFGARTVACVYWDEQRFANKDYA